jgi:flagellar L-ring protein precursor FlgH
MTRKPLLIALLVAAASLPVAAQSLYDESRFQPLTADRRALGVGDTLTVLVFENASASQSADTVTEKNGGVNLAAGVSGATNRNYGVRVSTGDEFTGKGRIQRSGRLAASITVTVTEVLANGDLRVGGKQQIVVNGETQLLQLAGRVRPVDINDGNTVASTRLADAEITYVGDGILAEKQRQGVLTRFLSWLGLL